MRIDYIIYRGDGKILRSGNCPAQFFMDQVGIDEFIRVGIATDSLHKIVDGQIIEKGPEETPVGLEEEEMIEEITKGEWQNVLDRLTVLENK